MSKDKKQKTIPVFNSDTERHAYLSSRGYELHRTGNGGHSHWRHADVYASAVERKVKLPQNLAGISTVAKIPGEITLCTGCKPFTWEGIIKQINWAAEDYVAHNPEALKASIEELRRLRTEFNKHRRELQNEKRAKSQMQRALCQAFKEAGVKGAMDYLLEIGPAIDESKAKINALQMAVHIMGQRVGTPADRASGNRPLGR